MILFCLVFSCLDYVDNGLNSPIHSGSTDNLLRQGFPLCGPDWPPFSNPPVSAYQVMRFWVPLLENLLMWEMIEETGEMVMWLRPLASLSEDLGSIPSPRVIAHNHLTLQLQGILCSLLASWPPRAPRTQVVHRYTFRQDMHMCKVKTKALNAFLKRQQIQEPMALEVKS